MSSKRFSVRFNMDNDKEARAWEYIHSNPSVPINKAIIEAITIARQRAEFQEVIKKAVAQALKEAHLSFASEQVVPNEENEGLIFDFLNSI